MIDPIIKDFSLNECGRKANKASPAPFASFKFSTNGSKVMYSGLFLLKQLNLSNF